jgi:hypothetical protein
VLLEGVARQTDGPDVMTWNAGKKIVYLQWQLFELLRRDLWHRASFAVLLLLLSKITTAGQSGNESSQRNPCEGEAAGTNGNADGRSAKPIEQG